MNDFEVITFEELNKLKKQSESYLFNELCDYLGIK